MKYKNINIISAVLAVNLLVPSISAFAATSKDITSSVTIKKCNEEDNLKTVLDDLVKKGTITSDKATTIEKALCKKHNDNIEKKNTMLKLKLDSLVKAGTITSDEKASIEKALSNPKGDLKTVLDSLVKEGTISSEKATAIENTFSKKHSCDNKQNCNRLQTELDTLVADGTITSNEKAAIENALSNKK